MFEIMYTVRDAAVDMTSFIVYSYIHDFSDTSQMSAPDTYQSAAIVDMMKSLNWSRLALLASLDDYGTSYQFLCSGLL